MWIIKFIKNAEKDKKLVKSAGLEDKVKQLLNLKQFLVKAGIIGLCD